MNFTSDNWSGAHPAISRNLERHAGGVAPAYGTSPVDRKVEGIFNEIFEREVAVYFVGTGTAANSLALSAIARPAGVTFCHREAHIVRDEGGAPHFFTGGGRLHTLPGKAGKIDAGGLREGIGRYPETFIHAGQPMAVSITQATEVGSVYSPDEVASLSAVSREFGLPMHMDGARFANALAALDVSPAEMTWKSGVDILSFGATKNGCWCAEALVFFDPKMAVQLPYIRKRAAHLFSKTRFIAAQLEAYFEGGLWLNLAKETNRLTEMLGQGLAQCSGVRLAYEPRTNEVFVVVPRTLAQVWREAGVGFYEWQVPEDLEAEVGREQTLVRFVVGISHDESDVRQVLEVVQGVSSPCGG
ncbi:threonine aldolase [Haloferula luteola]|uniref:L-threonine aldolase n=1 Tax=Haloferula luteola TaxID=595692 RepID=A0A840V7S2_9BACT|nr:low specificity L-threonine aldolase [Haloferula luteola]MBB5350788.1 threonine aldolase [Haloferula luteola]